MQRRDFVASALASSAGLAASQQAVAASMSARRWDMIIVGAGVTLGNAFTLGIMLTPALTLGHWLGETLPLGRRTA